MNAERMRNKLILKTPAGWQGDMWREALPSGNGIIGVSVYGAIKEETILVNHNELWHWGKRSPVPDVHDKFLEMRNLIEKGEYKQANGKMAQALLDRGYQSELYKPCPVGDIAIHMHCEKVFKEYSRSLDMCTGEIQVTWMCDETKYIRRTFVSRDANLILCEITSQNGSWDGEVFMKLHDTYHDDTKRMIEETEGKREHFYRNNLLYYRIQNEDGKYFGITGKVLQIDGNLSKGKNGGVLFKNCTNAVLAFQVFAKQDRNQMESLEKKFEKFEGEYDTLLDAHVRLHRPLYKSAEFHIAKDEFEVCNEELILKAYSGQVPLILFEKMWNYGRYLFISGTSETSNPFSMYGLWGGRYDLVWSHNMANINIQMIYWHCAKGGFASFIKCMISYYTNLVDDFRENARQMFGLKGIWIPAGTTPGYGLANQIVPVIVNWISAAGWLCSHFYEYYSYTKDEDTLKKQILPFMLETLAFYQDYLVVNKEGMYEIYPSVSPENTPGNLQGKEFIHLAHANPAVKNATMDFAILKEFLDNLIHLGEVVGIEEKKISEWQEMRKRIPQYQINSENAIKEWMDATLEDFYYHRHFSHLYPIYPGNEIEEMEEAEKKQFYNALKLRVLGGQTSWSLIFMGALYARFKDGENACSCLKHVCRTCLTNTFFTLHNDYRGMGMTVNLEEFAPVQLDAAVGYVAVIQEMLLQVFSNTIRLLPALPKEWSQGEIKGMRFPGGNIEMKWDLTKKSFLCKIRSEEECCLIIYMPTFIVQKENKIHMKKGQIWEYSC